MASPSCAVADPHPAKHVPLQACTSTSTSSSSSMSSSFKHGPVKPCTSACRPPAVLDLTIEPRPPELDAPGMFNFVYAGPATKVSFQACAHGGRRDKWTSFVCSLPGLESLAARCPGESESHKHAPWGCHFRTGRWRFSTAEEAEYPLALCLALSKALLSIVPASSSSHRLAFVEICCGCARASRVMRDAGCEVYPIDHARNEHTPEVEQLTIDIATTPGRKQLWALLNSLSAASDVHIVAVLFAVPCGTFSRAREKPMPMSLRLRGAPNPVPLRSTEHPGGLPNLKGLDADRVASANIIANLGADVLRWGRVHHIMTIIENPTRSILWEMPDMVDAMNCHINQPARPQPTPSPSRPSSSTSPACSSRKREPPPATSQPASKEAKTARAHEVPRAFLQPKASLTGPIVSVFKQHVLHRISSEPELQQAHALLQAKRLKQKATLGARQLPVGAHVQDVVEAPATLGSDRGAPTSFAKIAMPWTPQEFVTEALKLEVHPFDKCVPVIDAAKQAILTAVGKGPTWLAQHRRSELARWESLKASFSAKEDEIHKRLHPGAKAALSGTQLLLIDHLLKEMGWPDSELAGDLAAGLPIVGEIPRSGVFREQKPKDSRSVDWLLRSAGEWRAKLQSSITSVSKEIDAATLRGTQKEFDRNTMRGPLEIDEVTREVGPLWVPARRFTIQQGFETDSGEDDEGKPNRKPKYRQIDDYSEPGHNATAIIHEKIDTRGVDSTIGMAQLWGRALQNREGFAEFEMSDGAMVRRRVHPDWKRAKPELKGTLVDLQRAYRLVPRKESQRHFCFVMFWDSSVNRVRVAEHYGQPFGATAAVNNFNRLGRAIEGLFIHFLLVALSQYFDDFTIVEPDSVIESARDAVEGGLRILGLPFVCKQPPSCIFTSLGVEVNLSEVFTEQRITVHNSKKRVIDILSEIDDIERGGKLPPARAGKLRGRLGFAGAQHFGRTGKYGLRALSVRQYQAAPPYPLDQQLKFALSWWREYFATVPPRTVPVLKPDEPPAILFTDGWQGVVDGEPTLGIGAVLFSPRLPKPQYFGARVADSLVSAWGECGKTMLINQAELLPCLMARLTWPEVLSGARLLSFVDNDACRDCLIRGYSPVAHSASIIARTWLSDAQLCCSPWVSRVPSEANISDGPSRLSLEEVTRLGFQWKPPVWPLGDLVRGKPPPLRL
jgi:hypothetical protein